MRGPLKHGGDGGITITCGNNKPDGLLHRALQLGLGLGVGDGGFAQTEDSNGSELHRLLLENQLRIPATALVAKLLLGQDISRQRWLAVAMLTAGVILVGL